jgi:transposase
MALEISDRHSAGELRAMARREKNGRVASRMLAIANSLDGMSRADAARAAGMDRQTLRDWVVRYGADGVAGLHDRPKGHPAPRLTEGELAALSNVIFRGPNPEKDGISTWTLSELCRWIGSHFGKSLHPASLSRILRHNGFSRQKTRPSHPAKDPKAQERFKKRGSARP